MEDSGLKILGLRSRLHFYLSRVRTRTQSGLEGENMRAGPEASLGYRSASSELRDPNRFASSGLRTHAWSGYWETVGGAMPFLRSRRVRPDPDHGRELDHIDLR